MHVLGFGGYQPQWHAPFYAFFFVRSLLFCSFYARVVASNGDEFHIFSFSFFYFGIRYNEEIFLDKSYE